MLRQQAVTLVLKVIAAGFIVIFVMHMCLRSTSSFKYKKDEWLKFLTYSGISYSYPRILNEIKESNVNECVPMIQQNLHEEVTDTLLKNVITKCMHSGVIAKPVLFNMSVIKEFMSNLSCPSATFLKTPRPLVALASYPGSGNTWTRELIEVVTGTLTGSIYTDWNFKGSEMCPARGKIYIVKTHDPNNRTVSHDKCREMGIYTLNYTKAVLILRNPYEALLAEFNRQQSLHNSWNPGVGLAPKSDFETSRWKKFVKKESETWKNMAIYWLSIFRKPVYVLIYDALWNYTVIEMYKLSQFLNITTTLKSLYCLSGKGVGNFKRNKPKWMAIETLFDSRLRKVVNDKIRSVLQVYEIPELYSYILSEC
ncbi:WSCD family member CG9164-like [Mercenaria mercenaria]|uniref:WSCD family member CG9164-like n=1 Tax=Mercenaria mercenaria TaxID=6596 RepID=UPI001E1DB3BF|nr:WSCD family member CG9164-like [Mercenaria mercenaria]